jgi:hypothetical protein
MMRLPGKAAATSRMLVFSTPKNSVRDTFSKVITFSTNRFGVNEGFEK